MNRLAYIIEIVFVINFISCTSTNNSEIALSPLPPVGEANGDNNLESNKMIVTNDLHSLNKINVNPTIISIPREASKIEMHTLVKNCRFIKLETNDKCLIGNIRDLQFDLNRIFVFDKDHQSIYEFNNNGKFICKIGQKGRGPGEYNNLWNFAIDRKHKQVCILDHAGMKLIFYNYKGKFLKTTPLYYRLGALSFFNDYTFSLTRTEDNDHIPNFEKHQITISKSSDFVPLNYILSNIPNPYQTGFNLADQRPFRTSNNGIYYSDILSPDTIWLSDGTKYRAAIYIDLHRNAPLFSQKDKETLTNETYFKKTQSNGAYMHDYFISPNFIVISLSINPNKEGEVFYCKKTGHVICGNPFYPALIYKRLYQFLWNSTGTIDFIGNNDDFIKVLQPYNLLSYQKNISEEQIKDIPAKEKKFFKSVNPEDNPILMVLNFKNF